MIKKLCEAMGAEITKTELLNAFIALTKDVEAEVRTAAAYKITDVCSLIPKDKIISTVIPAIKALVTDKSEHVRCKRKINFLITNV